MTSGLLVLTTSGIRSNIKLHQLSGFSEKEVAVFSFRIQKAKPNASSILSTRGKIEKNDSTSSMKLTLAKLWNGPIVDRDARVLGFAHIDQTVAASRMSDSTAIRRLALDSKANQVSAPEKASFEQIRSACVLVVKWGSPTATGARYLHDEYKSENDPLNVRDPWCIACKGIGFIDCDPCLKGVVISKQRVQVGVNAITGGPIFATKGFEQRCSRCSGKGGFDCRHCTNGKLD